MYVYLAVPVLTPDTVSYTNVGNVSGNISTNLANFTSIPGLQDMFIYFWFLTQAGMMAQSSSGHRHLHSWHSISTARPVFILLIQFWTLLFASSAFAMTQHISTTVRINGVAYYMPPLSAVSLHHTPLDV